MTVRSEDIPYSGAINDVQRRRLLSKIKAEVLSDTNWRVHSEKDRELTFKTPRTNTAGEEKVTILLGGTCATISSASWLWLSTVEHKRNISLVRKIVTNKLDRNGVSQLEENIDKGSNNNLEGYNETKNTQNSGEGMSGLIRCRACDAEISVNAMFCVKCGEPNQSIHPMNTLKENDNNVSEVQSTSLGIGGVFITLSLVAMIGLPLLSIVAAVAVETGATGECRDAIRRTLVDPKSAEFDLQKEGTYENGERGMVYRVRAANRGGGFETITKVCRWNRQGELIYY